MKNTIQCTGCARKLAVPDHLFNQEVQCPSCGSRFIASESATVPTSHPSVPSLPQNMSTSSKNVFQDYGYDEREEIHFDENDGFDAPPRSRSSASYDEGDYDDDFYDNDRSYSPRRQRRDLEPHRSGIVLTLGIVGIIMAVMACGCPFVSVIGVILSPLAWIFGQADLRAMDRQRMDPDGRGSTQGGMVCGIIGTILNTLILLGTIAVFALMILNDV